MNKNDSKLIYGLILLVAASRLVPHPWNVAPIGALGLFSGAYLSKRIAWFIPVAALLLGDMLFGFYNPVVMIFVYCGFALSALIGRVLLHQRRSVHRLGISVLIGAITFFLISNFGEWFAFYPHTLDGLWLCYLNGLPYLSKSFIGDAVYSALLFGGFEAIRYCVAKQASTRVIEK